LEEAEAMAKKFEGFGPDIFLMGYLAWEKYLGKGNGGGLYTMIQTRQYEPGGVPKGTQ
jgi:hypothetical protein